MSSQHSIYWSLSSTSRARSYDITYLAWGCHHHFATAALVAGEGRDGDRGGAASLAHTARRAVSVGGILWVLRVRDGVNERVEPDHFPSMTGRAERAHPPSPLKHGAAGGCPERLGWPAVLHATYRSPPAGALIKIGSHNDDYFEITFLDFHTVSSRHNTVSSPFSL